MKQSKFKLAAALAVIALLLPGALVVMSAPSVSAATTLGRVTVSGTNILVDGSIPSQKFIGVVETTALQFAVLAYIYGDSSVAGKTSHLNGPDTSGQGYIPYHDTPEQFWHQYFALSAYYNTNLVRLGAGDQWGSSIQYEAWLYHHDAYIAMLRTICDQAEQHGVWVCLVLAGSQEYPTYSYGGSGTVFNPSSESYARYIAYCRDVMAELENENAIAMYDLFNEPDHNNVANNYWQGNKVAFNNWEKAVARDTAGASTHPRTMGVAGLGNLFGWGKADFDLATGNGGFEILHRHFYASASGSANTYLFTDPESWADQCGKPLYWGEIAYNGVYPLTRWSFAEESIWAAGGQAIAPMVLTGTPRYPYTGGLLPDPSPPQPPPLPELVFTSSPVVTATVGTAYNYRPTVSIECTLTISTDAAFLITSSDGSVEGTPDRAGSYTVSIAAKSADGRTIYQSYTLVVEPASIQPPADPPAPPVDGTDTTDSTTGNNTAGGNIGATGNDTGGSTGPVSNDWQTSFWTSIADWFRSVFGWGDGPATPNGTQGSIANESNPTSKTNGYLLDSSSQAVLTLGALTCIAAIIGVFLVVRRRA